MPVAKVWTGSAWAEVFAASDGSIPASIGDAKGDLIGFSAADTPVRIAAAASNGSVLTSDTTQTGGVGWSARAYGTMYPSAAANHTSSGNWQKVPVDAFVGEGFTLDNANDRITPNEAGIYAFQAVVGFTTTAAGQVIRSRVYITGSPSGAMGRMDPANTGDYPVVSSTAFASMTTSDYLELWAWQNIAASRAYLIDTAFNSLRVWRVR